MPLWSSTASRPYRNLSLHGSIVSDPDHHRYGQHLSVDEVNDLVKPSEEALDLVHEWLLENDITDFNHSPSKDWVEIYIPVDEAERLLDTEYHVYEHEDGSKLIRTPNYSLPSHLHEHIDTIQPTTSFFRTRPERSTALQLPPVIPAGYKPPTDPEIAKVCNVSSVTPQCFMHLYSTLGYKTKSKGKSKVSFTNYLGEVPIRPDTALFMKKYRPEGVSAAFEFKQQSIAGGPVQDGVLTPAQAGNGTSREANLDVQAILGISYPLPVSSWSTGGEPPFNPDLNTPDNTNEPYLVWQNYVLSQRSLPQVISNSYADDEQTVPKAYAERVCKQFALLGARGVSVLFASGDRGVGVNGTCLSNDGKNTRKFIPLFPSGCPYVTTIGATHEFQPEVVAFRAATYNATGGKIREIYASGSGFSNYFSRPAYQKKVVDAYVKDLKGKFDGLYNKGE